MAEMALGYGSEYQLFRFLGHHRNFLNHEISNALNTDKSINWLDYPCNLKRLSLDGEFKDVDCFNNEDVKKKWSEYWPATGNSQNWDGVFTIEDTWYFVEAKAHESEVESLCRAVSEKSLRIINKAFSETIQFLHAEKTAEEWMSEKCKSYQLANRLAFINFCKKNGIKTKLLYINFINGYHKPETNEDLGVKNKEEWISIWNREYSDLGISTEAIKEMLYHVYIDCYIK